MSSDDKKDPLEYLSQENLEEIAKIYEHEKKFYESIGADEDFNVICIPMPDGSYLTEEEKSEIYYRALEDNTDLVYQLGLEDGSMVAFVIDPVTQLLKEDSKFGYLPSLVYEFHG